MPSALPPHDIATLLRGAEAPQSRPEDGAEAIARALVAEPDDPDVRLAAYRFHFFAHDHAAAQTHAWALLGHAARRLNVAPDWRDVRPGDADFTVPEFAPGLYLQVLVALGFCAARIGDRDAARELLAKSVELDPTDRFGGGWLMEMIDRDDCDD